MRVYLSALAEVQLGLLLDEIEMRWNIGIRRDVQQLYDASFRRLETQPFSCQKVETLENLFRCVVSEQSSFYYRVSNEELEVVSISDNRRNPEDLLRDLRSLL